MRADVKEEVDALLICTEAEVHNSWCCKDRILVDIEKVVVETNTSFISCCLLYVCHQCLTCCNKYSSLAWGYKYISDTQSVALACYLRL